MELGEEPTVEIAANLLKELCYNYRDSLTAGMIVAGWDAQKGSQVYSIPIGGMCVRQKIVTGGSGSTFVYGYIDKYYKPTMTREECIEFVKNGNFVLPKTIFYQNQKNFAKKFVNKPTELELSKC